MTIKVTYNVTDVYMSQSVSPVYINVSYSDGGALGGGVWGSITGTLSNQTDLQTALDLKVPYSGATGNVNLGEYELKAGQVTLDTSPTGTAAVGTIRWNDSTGTSETTLKGGNVIIKNGVDLVARVVNKVTPNTTLTKAAYQAVRVSGAQGQRLAVALAQANNDAGSADTIGLVTETIAPNQEGFIMTMGQLENINTTGSLQGETWVDGDVLYLSPTTAGAITNVKPTGATGHIVVIGYVEYAHANNGKIYIKIMNGWELDELHNVSIVTPTNNQGLFYNSSNSLWENKSIATVLGYTPEQPLTFNSPLSRAGNVVSIPQATGSVNGFLSATDWTTFNSKQAALGFTPANAATTITINGVTFDLSANRSWTIAAGISGSGASGQVTYWTGASAVSGSADFTWNGNNIVLGNNKGLVLSQAGTNRSISLLAGNIVDNYAGLTIYPAQGSNVGNALIVVPKGTGYSAIIKTGISVFNTDFVADNTNYEFATFRAGGTSFVVATGKNGLGQNRPFLLSSGFADGVTNPNHLWLYTTGNVGINTSSDLGVRFGVVGDTLLRGSGSTIATTALTVQNSSSTNLLRVLNDGDVSFGADAFYWDAVTSRLGIGTNAPAYKLEVSSSSGTGASGILVKNQGTGTTDFASINFQNNLTPLSNIFYTASTYTNSGLISANGFGHYTEGSGGLTLWANNGIIKFATGTTSGAAGSQKMTLFTTGNLGIGTGSTDNGQRLQVIGDTLLRGSGATSATTALTVQNSSSTNLLTVRNDGLATFGGNISINLNQNATTLLTITNTTSGTAAQTNAVFTSDINSGVCSFGKYSSLTTAFKIISAKDFYLYNGTTGGNITLYNDFPTGTIKMAAGGSSSTQVTIKAGGQVRFHPLASAPSGAEAGDVYYDSTLNKLRVYTTAWETITSI